MNNSPSKYLLNIPFVREKPPKSPGDFCCYRHELVNMRFPTIPLLGAMFM